MESTSINWGNLNELCAYYQEETQDLKSELYNFTGLHLKISDLEKSITKRLKNAKLDYGLTITVDTLEVDQPMTKLQVGIFQLVARQIIVSAPKASIQFEAAPDAVSIAIFLQNCTEELTVAVRDQQGKATDGIKDIIIPASIGITEDEVSQYDLGGFGEKPDTVKTLGNYFTDPTYVKSLESSFQAATYLIYGANADEITLGYNMLKWVNLMANYFLEINPKPDPTDQDNWSQLHDLASQSASLILMDTRNQEAIAVPLLSSNFYAESVDVFFRLAISYQQNVNEFSNQANLAENFAKFALTLKQNTESKKEALVFALAQVYRQRNNYQKQLITTKNYFDAAQEELKRLKGILEDAEKTATIINILEAVWGIGQAVVSMGVAAGDVLLGNEAGGAAQAAQSLKSVQSAFKAIKVASSTIDSLVGMGKILNGAMQKERLNKEAEEELNATKEKIKIDTLTRKLSAMSSQQIWNEIQDYLVLTRQDGESKITGIKAPKFSRKDLGSISLPAINGVDPVAYWSNYVDMVDNSMSSLLESKNTQLNLAAGNYFEKVKEMAEFGKSYAAKQTTIMQLQAKAMDIVKQIQADEEVEARWTALEKDEKSAEIVNARKKSIIQQQLISTKRSLFVELAEYNAAYMYWNLEHSGIQLNMNQDVLPLQTKIKKGVESLLNSQTSQDFDDVSISFHLGGENQLAFKKSNQGNQLTFQLALDNQAIQEQLASKAVYITDAQFFLEGAAVEVEKGISKEEAVISLEITTSAYFELERNQQTHRFVCEKPIDYLFNYRPSSQGNDVIVPWKPATEVSQSYMKPSPFTTWTITVKDGDVSKANKLIILLKGREIKS